MKEEIIDNSKDIEKDLLLNIFDRIRRYNHQLWTHTLDRDSIIIHSKISELAKAGEHLTNTIKESE